MPIFGHLSFLVPVTPRNPVLYTDEFKHKEKAKAKCNLGTGEEKRIGAVHRRLSNRKGVTSLVTWVRTVVGMRQGVQQQRATKEIRNGAF